MILEPILYHSAFLAESMELGRADSRGKLQWREEIEALVGGRCLRYKVLGRRRKREDSRRVDGEDVVEGEGV